MTLRPGEYRATLDVKLREEVDELIAAQSTEAVIEEAADIVEVLAAVAGTQGHTLENIVAVAERKCAARGGFSMRLWLSGVDH